MDQTSTDRRIQAIRTYLPGAVAYLVLQFTAKIPAAAAALAAVDAFLQGAGWAGVTALQLIQAAVVGAAIVGYQRLAQVLGNRSRAPDDFWDRLERILLGSSERPTYSRRSPR